jgi:hypothetical protein
MLSQAGVLRRPELKALQGVRFLGQAEERPIMRTRLVFICLAAALSAGAAADARAQAEAPSAELAGVNANAAVDGSSPLTAGSIVKDARGATVGRIERVVDVPDGADRVVLRIGGDLVSAPASSFAVTDGAVTTPHTKAELREMARTAGS